MAFLDDNFMITLSNLINNQDWSDRTALSASLRKLGAGDGYTTAFTSDRWDLTKSDADMAAVLVQNRVNIAEGNLPSEVIKQGITTKKQSTNIVMIISLEADSSIYDGLYLSNYATLNFSDPLSRLNGVGNVTVFGAGDYGMRVWLNPEVMRMRNVTPDDVYNAISAQNIEVSAGGIGQPPQSSSTKFQYTLTTKGRLSSVSEFENIIIKSGTTYIAKQALSNFKNIKELYLWNICVRPVRRSIWTI